MYLIVLISRAFFHLLSYHTGYQRASIVRHTNKKLFIFVKIVASYNRLSSTTIHPVPAIELKNLLIRVSNALIDGLFDGPCACHIYHAFFEPTGCSERFEMRDLMHFVHDASCQSFDVCTRRVFTKKSQKPLYSYYIHPMAQDCHPPLTVGSLPFSRVACGVWVPNIRKSYS